MDFLVGTGAPDYSLFTNNEMHILSSVAKFFESKTASETSQRSHLEQGYQKTCDSQIISYEFADGLVGVE